MNIKISDHFTYHKLLRFVFPSIIMMVFSSIYGVVDGLFVSNIVGKTAFTSVSLIMPYLMILGTVGFMFGSGGSAIVAKTFGMGEKEKANRIFSMILLTAIAVGIVLTVAGFVTLRPISIALGAEGEVLEGCIVYGRIIILAITAFILQHIFQSFFVVAEKPKMGLIITVISGVMNMVLDFLFMAVFHMGIVGAALATAISQVIGGIYPFIYFCRKNTSILKFTKTRVDFRIIGKACANGSSELMTNLSMSLVSIVYNLQLIKYLGENGVAAFGVIMYVYFIFASIFIGYSIGSAPIIGYHYGAENHKELKGLFRKSMILIGIGNVICTIAAIGFASPLSKIFVGYDSELLTLTIHGFKLYSISFLLAGFNIFASAFFTALNNGVVSALISFLRTLLFQIVAVLLLPIIIGIDGVWLAIVVAEAVTLVMALLLLWWNNKEYHYL